ncbi:MAG TPA: hypothetical protein VHV49_09305 [Pseudonocardiaceae bacterium]|nr:hypothetical protein [Pseudonocardiaceae bacterium]
MPFSNWGAYADLLGKLSAAKSNWSDAADFTQFDDQVRKNCGDLADGYAALSADLIASGDYEDRNLLFQHVRIAALAQSAEAAGMGADWAGYWISTDLRNQSVYAESRYASPGSWAAVAGEDGGGDADQGQPDLTVQHYDPDTGRWRRLNTDAHEFEYYAEDGAWERRSNDTWHRFHAGVEKWLPYDARSGLWWYADQWRAQDAVAAADRPPTPASSVDTAPDSSVDTEADEDDDEIDFAALAEQMVNETIADMTDDDEPWTEQERADMIAAVRHNLESADSGE